MSANAVTIAKRDRFDSLDVALIEPRRADSRPDASNGRAPSLARTALETATHANGVVCLPEPVSDDIICDGMVGRSETLRNVVTQLETVAPTDSTVLICGETGTGKELVARAVHNLSARRLNAFVTCNCAAVWPRKRRVYRRDRPAYRSIRAGQSRHDIPRRGRRDASRTPAQAASCSPRT